MKSIVVRQHTHKLLYNSGGAFTSPALVFEHLVRLAQPIMRAYRSDLFHDAIWLNEYVNNIAPEDTKTFYWYLGDSHTHISKEPLPENCISSQDHCFTFTVSLTPYAWWELSIGEQRKTNSRCRTCGEGGHQILGQCLLCATRPHTATEEREHHA